MLSEWELCACANHYIRKYSDDAPIHAAMQADKLLAEGDLEGAKNFRAIFRRINRLLDTRPDRLN